MMRSEDIPQGVVLTAHPPKRAFVMDGLQYCAWSRPVFEQMREGGVDAVHATLAYHENFRETVDRIVSWDRLFADNNDLIAKASSIADIEAARASGRTAVLFGVQNPSPIEADLGLVSILRDLGVCFMQLTYNNQSLLGAGWQESGDGGLTRMGRLVIAEMNRLGIVIDMSHAGELTTLEAIRASRQPVAVTHANPRWWRDTGRNVSDEVIRALADTGGMLGLSLYPHHLAKGSACTLAEFCAMAARLAEVTGVERLGIGSDLCQGHSNSIISWMRDGRWTSEPAENPNGPPLLPAPLAWFRSNADFPGLRAGLRGAGFSDRDADGIMGENWMRFLRKVLSGANGVSQ